jgi:hypothetical protein
MKISFWDVLSILLLVGIVGMILVFGAIFANPTSAYNLFPPPTAIPTIFVPTATSTLRVLPGYSSPTPPQTSTPVGMKPSSTPLPSRTSFVLPTATPTFTPTNTPTNTPTITNTPTVTRTSTATLVPTVDTLATAAVIQTATAAAANQTATAESQNQTATAAAGYPPP